MAIDAKKEHDFEWVGRDKTGKRIEGNLRATSATKVRSLLNAQGIQALSVNRAKVKKGKGGKVNQDDIMLFARQLATMLTSGIPLSEAIGMQANGAGKVSVQDLLSSIKADVDRGGGLTNALAKHPDVFSRTFIGLTAAGERSGTIEKVLNQLADYLEKSQGIKKTVKKALVYPSAVITIALGITALILWKVVPVFADMFRDQGRELPGPTQFVVNLSNLITSPSFLVVLLMIAAVIFVFRKMVKNSPALKYKVDGIMLKMPVFGNLIALSNSANFASTLATMYEAGTPMISSLQTVSQSTNNSLFREAVDNIRENVSIGQELNFAMRQSKMFPDMVTYMVGIGEKSGNLSDMLTKVSEIYIQDIDNAVDAMMSLIEPILIVVLGCLVGGIVVAMYLPLFSMADGI